MKNKRYKASGEDSGAVWQLQEAKACFSEVVRRAEACPQKVTVRGKDAVVVLSASDYECLRPESKQGLSELMAASPLAEVEFGKRGDGMPVREVDL